jgi:hypothetical protein
LGCKHSTRSDASPATCSQCLGTAAHRVDQDGAVLTVDGKPSRTIAVGDVPIRDYYRHSRGGRRGGRARAQATSQSASHADPVAVAAGDGDADEE